MPAPKVLHRAFAIAALALAATPVALSGQTGSSAAKLFPETNRTGVNPDTHIVVTFASTPTVGKSGLIRILDASTNQVVDALDLSIPAGPDPKGPRAATPTVS